MYKPSGGDSRVSAPPNARDTSSLPPEHSAWQRDPHNRDPRGDRGVDRDRNGPGKRNWSGDRSSSVSSFHGATGGASMNGNGFVPRSKPRFQGHYSGFFAESGRNAPPFSSNSPVDNGLVRRFNRNPFHFGTSPPIKSPGFSGGPGLDYRANDTEERHSRDQFLPSGDGRDARDQPLPPHTPHILSDSTSIPRNGERAKSLNSRGNWDLPQRTDRENLARPHGNPDFHSRRRSIITNFDSGKDWGSADQKSEGSRSERYGAGNRDGAPGDSEGISKDSSFLHGWRRDRGSSGAGPRNSGFLAGNKSSIEHGGRAPLLAASAILSSSQDMLSSSLDADQPSPSKRPRLGWGQGLAKYEKKIGDNDDTSPLGVKGEKKQEGRDEKSPVEEYEKKRGGEDGEQPVVVQEYEFRRGGENCEKPVLMQENEKSRAREDDKQALLMQDYDNGRALEDDKPLVLVEEHENKSSSWGSKCEVGREVENEKIPAFAQEEELENKETKTVLFMESEKDVEHEPGHCAFLTEAGDERGGESGTSPALQTESEIIRRSTNDTLPVSLRETAKKNPEESDVICSDIVQSSIGIDMCLSPSLLNMEEISVSNAPPAISAEERTVPVEAPNLPVASVPSSTLECQHFEENLTGMSATGKHFEEVKDLGIDSCAQPDLPAKRELEKTAASPGPCLSQVCGEVIISPSFETVSLEAEPVGGEYLITESLVVEDHATRELTGLEQEVVSNASLNHWTEETLLKAVEGMEFEIDLVKKEIAELETEDSNDVDCDQKDQVTAYHSHEAVSAEEGPVAMDEDFHDACGADYREEAFLPSSKFLSTSVSTTQEESTSASSKRGGTDILPLYRSTGEGNSAKGLMVTHLLEKGELNGGLLEGDPKSMITNTDSDLKDITGVNSPRSVSTNAGSEGSFISEGQLEYEVAADVDLDIGSMVKSLMLENREKARLSAMPFTHLLSQQLTGEARRELYCSPMEAPVWQQNMETHQLYHDKLLKNLATRHYHQKFKERVLTLRFRALKDAWKREQESLCERRHRSKAGGRWDLEGRNSHGPSQRISLRSRPKALSVGRLDAGSQAAHAMQKLMKDPPLDTLRSVQKMPAMILDEKERIVRRFVSNNALVSDPVAVELERRTINPWTSEEKKMFIEKFAIYNKDFSKIASHLEYKTTADCVEYYYRNQKSDDFEKTQRRLQLKNRRDYTRTTSSFLAPTTPGSKRLREANAARVESLSVAAISMKSSERNSHLQVAEHAKPTASSSGPCFLSPFEDVLKSSITRGSELLEVALASGPPIEAATSSLISTPCSVSSTAVPSADQCKEKFSSKDGSEGGPSTTRISHSEQHAAGLKGTRSMHLRRGSSRSAAQEVDAQWTDGERELFTNAVAMFGKDFRLIASHVGSKSQSQCKAFFSKTRKRLALDELVEQFQANEAAMLVQSFRQEGQLVSKVKATTSQELKADSLAGVEANDVEELMETATAVSTLESLKGQPKSLANDMLSDLSLVADAAAVMEEKAPVKAESPVLRTYGRTQTSTTGLSNSAEQMQDLPKFSKIDHPDLIVALQVMKDEDEDSEATRSDDSYQAVAEPEVESDVVVDQAAAALVGMSVMFSDLQGLKRSKSEVKPDPVSSPVSVFARSHSARLPFVSPPAFSAVAEANLTMVPGKIGRQMKERASASFQCKSTTKDRSLDMQDTYSGRKSRETTGGEVKPRREPTSWTQEEKEKFAVILQEHGKDWALLHESLPSKSLTQIKTYFQNSKARSRLPASDKLVSVVRSGTENRKRKAEEFETSRKAADLALPLKQKVRGTAVPEIDTSPQKDESSMGPAAVTGTATVGVDILAYAARFSPYPGQSVDQSTLSMSGMQNLVRQMACANSYAQGTSPGAQQVFRPGARPALPSSVVPVSQNSGGMLQQLSGSAPPNSSQTGGHELQALSPGVAQQAGPPAIHQVAQQMQQVIAQQQQLQKQLAMLMQQQAHPQQLLQQLQQSTQPSLQPMQPLEQKLQQVVQQLQQQQQQHEQQGRAQAQSLDGEVHGHVHFQRHQSPQARGILKVRPIRGGVTNPEPELTISTSSGLLQHQINSRNHDKHLQQQEHSMLSGMSTIPTSTAGSTAGLAGHHCKEVELDSSDTDTDCEGIGSRVVAADDSHQRMSVVHSTSSGQQQGAAQSTTSTLSSDSEQVKPWDVKLFGQSLLSKPPSLPLTVPRLTGGTSQELVHPTPSVPVATLGLPPGTLSKGFRSSESLPSAFGRVGAPSAIVEAQAAAWPGKSAQPVALGSHSPWSTSSSLQVSGVTEPVGKELETESVQEALSSMAERSSEPNHSDAKSLTLAPPQSPLANEDLCKIETHLSSGHVGGSICGTAIEDR